MLRSYSLLCGVVLALAPLAAAAAVPADDDPHTMTCVAVRGTLVPSCNGNACGQGTVTGDLKGRFSSRVTSQYIAGSGWLYSTWMKIELDGRQGLLDLVGSGTLPFDAVRGPDMAPAVVVLRMSESTGRVLDDRALVVLSGGHLTGASAAYSGRLCHHL
jgi:hypothetical protein